MQKNVIKLLFIISSLDILIGCSSKTYPSGVYQQAPVAVDGDLSEWSEPLRFTSTGGQVQYNVTNDDKNLYIALETHDESTALKILRAGINTYIDVTGGKGKTTCLAFPIANTNPPAKRSGSGAGKSDGNEFRNGLLATAITFNASGFKNMENRAYDVSDKKAIKVALKSLPYNGLGYEAVIPLQYIYGSDLSANNANHNMSVGITINAIKSEGQSQKSNNSYAGGGSGMHGGHGGGGGGRGMGGGGNYHRGTTTDNQESTEPGVQTPDRTALYKADVNWYAFKLAGKK